MTRLDEILKSIMADTDNPAAAIAREKARTGKLAVGCMLEFCPEELIYAGGMLPVGIWGGPCGELRHANQYFPTFFCPPIQQSLELALRGVFDGVLSAVMVPILCDAMKSAGQNWRIAVPSIPMIPVTYPQNRKLASGRKFLCAELDSARKKLEEVCGHQIEDNRINDAIQVYDQYRKTMQEFAAEAVFHADIVTPTVRHSVFQTGFFRDKKDYTTVVQELIAALQECPRVEGRCRVALTGIALDSPKLLKALEKNGMTVTADTLAQEYGQVMVLTPGGEDPLARIADRWAEMRLSSLVVDEHKERVDNMVSLVKQGKADAVIVSAPAFCDPEEYDYPIFHAACQKAGIHHLYLELSDQSTAEQAESRLQALADVMS